MLRFSKCILLIYVIYIFILLWCNVCILVGRITDGESLFWYRPGWNTDTYTNKNFQPLFFLNFTSGPDLSVCNNDLDCEYDVFLTHDRSIGQDTVFTRLEVEDKASILGRCSLSSVSEMSDNGCSLSSISEISDSRFSLSSISKISDNGEGSFVCS